MEISTSPCMHNQQKAENLSTVRLCHTHTYIFHLSCFSCSIHFPGIHAMEYMTSNKIRSNNNKSPTSVYRSLYSVYMFATYCVQQRVNAFCAFHHTLFHCWCKICSDRVRVSNGRVLSFSVVRTSNRTHHRTLMLAR